MTADNQKNAERLATLREFLRRADVPNSNTAFLLRLLDAAQSALAEHRAYLDECLKVKEQYRDLEKAYRVLQDIRYELQSTIADSARLSAERDEWWTATLAAADDTIAVLREERDLYFRRAADALYERDMLRGEVERLHEQLSENATKAYGWGMKDGLSYTEDNREAAPPAVDTIEKQHPLSDETWIIDTSTGRTVGTRKTTALDRARHALKPLAERFSALGWKEAYALAEADVAFAIEAAHARGRAEMREEAAQIAASAHGWMAERIEQAILALPDAAATDQGNTQS